MERGIYFDGWPHHNYCYHPSLPMRSQQMILDLEKYHGTLLVWSALGGGSISLPFLEHEAWGPVDPRQRFYGHMNDSEFIHECKKRGIRVFGIVFEVQGWEFPVRVSEDGKLLLDFNVMRDGPGNGSGVGQCGSRHDGEGVSDWYGLREFSQGRHDSLFPKTFSDYFPEGLTNSDGEKVTDLWSECAAKDYNGVPVHADWVEVTEHQHQCYQMCRNNPVWRTYLKKIIEIQIDAGCDGIQLDECELPITAFRYGGCFCKDCRKQFTAFLKGLKKENKLEGELNSIDLDQFDYGAYLKERDISFPNHLGGVPFFREYYEFQMRAVKKYFIELVDYAKEYGRKFGRDISVSGNFFNLMPVYYPLEPSVDVIITEMKQTVLRQPYWYRYAAGFAGEKPIIVAENPYGGIIHELAEQLEEGKGFDLYRLLLLEASVYGCNMAVPYGAWMGNAVKTGFYPPRRVTAEVQDFLFEKEYLFSKKSGANVCVLYSFPSYYWREAVAGYSGNLEERKNSDSGILSYFVSDIEDPKTPRMPFYEVIKLLSDQNVCYDVKFLADDDLRPDDFSLEEIASYEMVIVPDCPVLTENQSEVLCSFADQGGLLVLFGDIAASLASKMKDDLQSVLSIKNEEADKTGSMARFADLFFKAYDPKRQITVDQEDIGIQTHQLEKGGLAIHLLNYRYRKSEDQVEPILRAELTIRHQMMDLEDPEIKIHTLNDVCQPGCKIQKIPDGLSLALSDLPLYTVIEISRKAAS